MKAGILNHVRHKAHEAGLVHHGQHEGVGTKQAPGPNLLEAGP